MKKIDVFKSNTFSDKAFKRFLVHDSPYIKIIILDGEGEFLGDGGSTIPARTGNVLPT